jgi:hypothetical protein
MHQELLQDQAAVEDLITLLEKAVLMVELLS